MKSKRSLSVDVAKGIAIIAIVFGHVEFSYPKGTLVDLTPNIENNITLLLLYATFGVGFPIVFTWGFRRVKKQLLLWIKLQK